MNNSIQACMQGPPEPERGGVDGEFRRRVVGRCRRGRRVLTRRASPCRRAARATGERRRVAGVGRARCARRLPRSRNRGALVASGASRRTRARGQARRHQHRHRVGQVAGVPTSDNGCPGAKSTRPRAVLVADESAWPRPVAGRALADHRGAPARRRGADLLRRRHTDRGTQIRPRTVPVAVLQSRHDPPVAAAQPCPVGGVPARAAVHRGRRMPLLPRHFRLQRGDGPAPPASAL